VVPAEFERSEEDRFLSQQLHSLSQRAGNVVVVIPNLQTASSQKGLYSKGRCGVRYNGRGFRTRRRGSIRHRDIQFLRLPTILDEIGTVMLADKVRVRERTSKSLWTQASNRRDGYERQQSDSPGWSREIVRLVVVVGFLGKCSSRWYSGWRLSVQCVRHFPQLESRRNTAIWRRARKRCREGNPSWSDILWWKWGYLLFGNLCRCVFGRRSDGYYMFQFRDRQLGLVKLGQRWFGRENLRRREMWDKNKRVYAYEFGGPKIIKECPNRGYVTDLRFSKK